MSSDPREVVNGGGTVAGYDVLVVEMVVVMMMGPLVPVLQLSEASEAMEVRDVRLDERFSAVIDVVRKVAIGRFFLDVG